MKKYLFPILLVSSFQCFAQWINQIGFIDSCNPDLKVWVHGFFGASLPPYPINLIGKKDTLINDTVFVDFKHDYTLVAAAPCERLDTLQISCNKYSGQQIDYLCVRQLGYTYDFNAGQYIHLTPFYDIQCVSNSFSLSSALETVFNKFYVLAYSNEGLLFVANENLTLEIYDIRGRLHLKTNFKKNQRMKIEYTRLSMRVGVAVIHLGEGEFKRELLLLP